MSQTHQIPHGSLLSRTKHVTIGFVNDIAGSQQSLLALHCDGDEVDETVVTDQTCQSFVEKFVFLGEVVIRKGVGQVLQIKNISVVVKIKLEFSILFNQVNLKMMECLITLTIFQVRLSTAYNVKNKKIRKLNV